MKEMAGGIKLSGSRIISLDIVWCKYEGSDIFSGVISKKKN